MIIKIQPKRWYFQLKNWWDKLHSEQFICPSNHGQLKGHEVNYWQVRGNDKVCNFCGAWHPLQFLKFCEIVIEDPDSRLKIEYVPGKGKFYIDRPNVRNGKSGAIKTYSLHIHQYLEDHGYSLEKINEYNNLIHKAVKASRKKLPY